MDISELNLKRAVKFKCLSMLTHSNLFYYFRQLKNEGYRLKHMYKNETQPFAIVVKPGESTAVVLKKINDDESYFWPPKGIAIFQK